MCYIYKYIYKLKRFTVFLSHRRSLPIVVSFGNKYYSQAYIVTSVSKTYKYWKYHGSFILQLNKQLPYINITLTLLLGAYTAGARDNNKAYPDVEGAI